MTRQTCSLTVVLSRYTDLHNIIMSISNAVLREGAPQHWLLAVSLAYRDFFGFSLNLSVILCTILTSDIVFWDAFFTKSHFTRLSSSLTASSLKREHI